MMLPTFEIVEAYSIGRLESPGPNDEQFAELDAAEIAAIEASIDDGVWGVWENKSGELMAIVYQLTSFHP